MKTVAVIQARMGSSRLRGKTLSPIGGVPLLKYVYNTISNFGFIDDIIVATSNQGEDDPIDGYISKYLSCKCHRGDSNNVFSRFYEIATLYKENDTIIRITADNIFYQKELCEELLKKHILNNNDYTGILGLSHIVGEFIRVGAFISANKFVLSDFEKEHVTPYFIDNPKEFKTQFVNPTELSLKKEMDKLLTIDTAIDRDRVENIITDFKNKNRSFTQENLYNWLINNKK